MRLWIDDLRPAPEGWVWTKSSQWAITILQASADGGSVIDEISFDHDLGGDDTTRPVALWLAEHDAWPPVVRVHSMNNVGREWLEGIVNRYAPPGTLRK